MNIDGLSIIILNLNGQDLLTKFIPSLDSALSPIKNINLEIIIVDNGSTDDSLKLINSFFQSLDKRISTSLIKNSHNLGFAAANNQGIKKAKFSWVALINNDLRLNPDWFEIILAQMKTVTDPQTIGFFGTILNHNGREIESQGIEYFIRGKAKNINNQVALTPKLKRQIISTPPYFIWGASAAAVIYHRPSLIKVGGFDPDFFAYEEDVDLSFRLNKLGYQTLYIPRAFSYHLGGATSQKMGNLRQIMDAKNWIYLILKNYSCHDLITNFGPIFEERLRNLSGLFKATLRLYGWNSFWYFPKNLILGYGQVIISLPRILTKRRQFFSQLAHPRI